MSEYFAVGRNRSFFLDRARRNRRALARTILIRVGLFAGLCLAAFAAGLFFGG